MEYRAVLFDWMLTLAEYPAPKQHVRSANHHLGREVDDADIARTVRRLLAASQDDDVVTAARSEDCSAEQHRGATMLLFDRAGIDKELAEAMYALLGDPTFHPIYPEVPEVLLRLSERNVKVVIVSDVHVDLRLHARRYGIDDLIDAWILSYEHGVQKPDPAIFRLALDAVHAEAGAALMVGDRASHDGAAATIGIDTLILPAPHDSRRRRPNKLQIVLRAVGA